jgi:hypothetical protein
MPTRKPPSVPPDPAVVSVADWRPGLPAGEPDTQKYEVEFTPGGAI